MSPDPKADKPPDGRSATGLCSGEAVIANVKGMHARASARFVKCAEMFDAEVRVTREGQTVLGTSIMGLMMLAAAQGNAIVIETKGAEAQDAFEALVALVEAGFDEEG
ncbi:MAG: HPr family phosphocarrier protein [Methyloligellaceae bacterium]